MRPAPRVVVLVAGAVLAACTGTTSAPSGYDTTAPGPAPEPAPPAACLLDVEAMTAATGLAWTPDAATASDTRCVYDPRGADPLHFVAVDVAPLAGSTSTELESVAEVCDEGTREAVGSAAFVCRFQGGSVFGASAGEGRVVTVAASAVPVGTTAEALASAFAAELARIGG